MTNHVRAQGAEAKKLGLTEYSNPYGPGDNHDDWRAGFGLGEDRTEEPGKDRKGAKPKKGGAKSVVKPTGTGETALTTKIETANPRGGEGPGSTVTVGDPSASTTAAGNDGKGIVLDDKA